MRYIITRGNSLHYQRTFPKHVQTITGRAMYQRLQLSMTADEREILLARDSLNQQFEQIVAAAEASLDNPQALNTTATMLDILQSANREQQLRLNDLWQEYCDTKRLKGRQRQIANNDWQRFIRLSGNLLANDDSDTNRRLNAALQAQFKTRQQQVKASTAKRELCQVIAALKLGAKKHQIYWRIDPLKSPSTLKQHSDALNINDILMITAALGNDTSSTDIDALLLLALTGGVTPADVARIRHNDLALDHATPHLAIRNSHNRLSRRVPIPLAADFLMHSIDGAINLANMSKGYISRISSARLQQILNRPNIGIKDLLYTYKTRCGHVDTTQNNLSERATELHALFSP